MPGWVTVLPKESLSRGLAKAEVPSICGPGHGRSHNNQHGSKLKMQITDILSNTSGLQSIAQALGVSDDVVGSGAKALLPAIIGGFTNQDQSQPNAATGLGDLIGQLGGSGLIGNIMSMQSGDANGGNGLLSALFGSQDGGASVAHSAASASGLDPALLQKMLPLLATLVAGFMGKQGEANEANSNEATGGLGGLLGSLIRS